MASAQRWAPMRARRRVCRQRRWHRATSSAAARRCAVGFGTGPRKTTAGHVNRRGTVRPSWAAGGDRAGEPGGALLTAPVGRGTSVSVATKAALLLELGQYLWSHRMLQLLFPCPDLNAELQHGFYLSPAPPGEPSAVPCFPALPLVPRPRRRRPVSGRNSGRQSGSCFRRRFGIRRLPN